MASDNIKLITEKLVYDYLVLRNDMQAAGDFLNESKYLNINPEYCTECIVDSLEVIIEDYYESKKQAFSELCDLLGSNVVKLKELINQIVQVKTKNIFESSDTRRRVPSKRKPPVTKTYTNSSKYNSKDQTAFSKKSLLTQDQFNYMIKFMAENINSFMQDKNGSHLPTDFKGSSESNLMDDFKEVFVESLNNVVHQNPMQPANTSIVIPETMTPLHIPKTKLPYNNTKISSTTRPTHIVYNVPNIMSGMMPQISYPNSVSTQSLNMITANTINNSINQHQNLDNNNNQIHHYKTQDHVTPNLFDNNNCDKGTSDAHNDNNANIDMENNHNNENELDFFDIFSDFIPNNSLAKTVNNNNNNNNSALIDAISRHGDKSSNHCNTNKEEDDNKLCDIINSVWEEITDDFSPENTQPMYAEAEQETKITDKNVNRENKNLVDDDSNSRHPNTAIKSNNFIPQKSTETPILSFDDQRSLKILDDSSKSLQSENGDSSRQSMRLRLKLQTKKKSKPTKNNITDKKQHKRRNKNSSDSKDYHKSDKNKENERKVRKIQNPESVMSSKPLLLSPNKKQNILANIDLNSFMKSSCYKKATT